LQKSLINAGENRDGALHELLLAMRTALITVDEIGLKQPTVCAVLLLRPVVNNEYALSDRECFFGGDVELILRGLKKSANSPIKRRQ